MSNENPAKLTVAEQSPGYQTLLDSISETYRAGQAGAAGAVNVQLLKTYWQIGRYIVEFEQGGQIKAEYGKALLKNLAKDLTVRHGRGFSRSNLYLMRQFFVLHPKIQTSGKFNHLTWSHYCELLDISDDAERRFYEIQTVAEKWSVRELKRQKDAGLYLRLALSKDKKGVLKLSAEGQKLDAPPDVLRDPYIFEFLDIAENERLRETELETRLADNLQKFLLELGKGFTFVGRQYRITLDNEHFYVDLVFYHRILRCFVLIDLKIGKVKHLDIGQMNMYLGYFAAEENIEGDNPPIGIILTQDKNDFLVEYATYNLNSQLFVSKYQLYLPNKDELRRQLEAIMNDEL